MNLKCVFLKKFTTNTAITPCICIPNRPMEDDYTFSATSEGALAFSMELLISTDKAQ